MNQIKKLREEKGKSMRQVASDIGIPYTTYVNYEKGVREPNSEMLVMLANYFSSSVDYLLGRTVSRNINDNPSYTDCGFLPPPNTVKKPRLGRISCGIPIDSAENFDGYDDVPDHIQCDFTLICEGDSMIGARIHDGDLVYIKQQTDVENGQIAAVLVDGEGKLLKRVYKNSDRLTLAAENPAYPPLIFVREEMEKVMIIGKAVGFTSLIR